MNTPHEIPDASLKKLIAPLCELGFSIAERIHFDPTCGHYLAVLKSNELYVKLGKDRSGSCYWVKSAETPDSSEWCELLYLRRLIWEQRNDRGNAPRFFTSDHEAVAYFVCDYDRIVSLFRSQSAAMIANRVRQIEEEERQKAFRSIGINYKKR